MVQVIIMELPVVVNRDKVSSGRSCVRVGARACRVIVVVADTGVQGLGF